MSRHRSVEEACIETQIEGHDVVIEFERVTFWCRDRHYGSDADGRRGEDVTYIDEELAEGITVSYYEDAVAHWLGYNARPYATLDEPTQLVVNKAIDEYMQRIEPTAPEEMVDRSSTPLLSYRKPSPG